MKTGWTGENGIGNRSLSCLASVFEQVRVIVGVLGVLSDFSMGSLLSVLSYANFANALP